MTDVTEWKNRIVGQGQKKASQFLSHPLNHRRHPQRQRNAVHGSLESLGWIDVVLENRTTGRLIDGHERVWQALKNGDAEVPYIEVELTEAEEAQALLSLDAIAALAETDGDNVQALLGQIQTDNADVMKFLTDFAAESGLDWNQPEERDAEPQIDRAAELLEKWQVKTGDLWQIGDHRLLCGDSTKREDVERVMGGENARLEFSDPPYDFETGGGGILKEAQHMKDIESAGINNFDPLSIELISRTSVFCCNKNLVPAYIELAKKNKQVWDLCFYKKQNTPPNFGGHLMTDTEYIPVIGEQSPNSGMEKDVYSKAYIGGLDDDHLVAWQKPVLLVEKFIRLFSIDNDVVIDRFVCTGTTLVACENLGRRGRAIEISPAYCAVTLERMATAFPEIVIKKVD